MSKIFWIYIRNIYILDVELLVKFRYNVLKLIGLKKDDQNYLKFLLKCEIIDDGIRKNKFI